MYVLTIPLCDSGGQNLLTSRTPRHTWGEHKSARQSCWSNLHMYMYDYMRCAVKHTTRRLRARSHTFVLAFIQLYVYVHVHIRLHWHSYNYNLRARSHTFVLAFMQLYVYVHVHIRLCWHSYKYTSTWTFTYVCAGIHTTIRLRERSHTFVLAFMQLHVYVHVHIRLCWHSYNYNLRARSHTFALALASRDTVWTFFEKCFETQANFTHVCLYAVCAPLIVCQSATRHVCIYKSYLYTQTPIHTYTSYNKYTCIHKSSTGMEMKKSIYIYIYVRLRTYTCGCLL